MAQVFEIKDNPHNRKHVQVTTVDGAGFVETTGSNEGQLSIAAHDDLTKRPFYGLAEEWGITALKKTAPDGANTVIRGTQAGTHVQVIDGGSGMINGETRTPSKYFQIRIADTLSQIQEAFTEAGFGEVPVKEQSCTSRIAEAGRRAAHRLGLGSNS